jgi:hypothetical protein
MPTAMLQCRRWQANLNCLNCNGLLASRYRDRINRFESSYGRTTHGRKRAVGLSGDSEASPSGTEPLDEGASGKVQEAAGGGANNYSGFSPNPESKWSPQFWANKHAALQFCSTEELDAAIGWLWEVPELRHLPRVHVGENTMIVPEGAVDAFRKRGYHFTVNSVVSAGDLPADEVNRIRREG